MEPFWNDWTHWTHWFTFLFLSFCLSHSLSSLPLLVLQNKAELFLRGSFHRCLVFWRDLVLSGSWRFWIRCPRLSWGCSDWRVLEDGPRAHGAHCQEKTHKIRRVTPQSSGSEVRRQRETRNNLMTRLCILSLWFLVSTEILRESRGRDKTRVCACIKTVPCHPFTCDCSLPQHFLDICTQRKVTYINTYISLGSQFGIEVVNLKEKTAYSYFCTFICLELSFTLPVWDLLSPALTLREPLNSPSSPCHNGSKTYSKIVWSLNILF